ncbi:MAG: hypothetical protein KDD32_13505 [Bacteroidetes bacterium]|nr:hypothetical protein [Bacteroidota bacterium]
MNSKWLKGILYILGLVSIAIFLITTFDVQPIKKLIISDQYEQYGELTDINRIADFKVKLPPKRAEYFGVPVKQAEVICFGDSYFNHVRFVNVPESISNIFDVPVSFIKEENPVAYLNANQYKSDVGKVLIYETTERLIAHRFSKPFTPKGKKGGIKGKIKKWNTAIFDKEMDYKYLLKSSIFTEWIYAKIATFKFRKFEYITSQTPLYDLDSKMLFLGPTTGNTNKGFYYQHSKAEINLYADNIQRLAQKMKDDYGLDFIFLPIPSKYTIYHTILNEDAYNELLPQLYAALKTRGIRYINLYDPYMQSKELLYHPTDSHWNEKGKDVCVNLVVKELKDGLLN